MTNERKLFRYLGAKTRAKDLIINHFPNNYRNMKYVEVFGGSAIILYYKPRSKMEIYNDYDEGVSSIFWCLVNEYEKFAFRLMYAQYSDHLFKWFKDPEYKASTRLDKAVQTLYLTEFAFSGKQGETLGRTPSYEHYHKNKYLLYRRNTFEKWRKRFKNVQIYADDFETLIKRVDEDNTFMYLDPPYWIATKGKTHYNINFSEEDHTRLRDTLIDTKSKWLISYDNVPEIHDLYSVMDVTIKEVSWNYTAARSQHKKYTELLIANYSLPKQTKIETFINDE